MSDAIQLGYQAALVSMHSPPYGRLWLSVEQHPGDRVPSTEAEAMVQAAESRTRARPWRRTGLLRERIEQHQRLVEGAVIKQDRALSRLSDCQERLDQVEQGRRAWVRQVSALEVAYQAHDRLERPHSRLAQGRRKLHVRERRWVRRRRDLEKAQVWLSRCQQKLAALQAEHILLEQRLARFIEDNRSNPSGEKVKHAVLLHYGPEPVTTDPEG